MAEHLDIVVLEPLGDRDESVATDEVDGPVVVDDINFAVVPDHLNVSVVVLDNDDTIVTDDFQTRGICLHRDFLLVTNNGIDLHFCSVVFFLSSFSACYWLEIVS